MPLKADLREVVETDLWNAAKTFIPAVPAAVVAGIETHRAIFIDDLSPAFIASAPAGGWKMYLEAARDGLKGTDPTKKNVLDGL